jgi:hypothetical protein
MSPLPPPFLRLLQRIFEDAEVRVCAALYPMLPRRRRLGVPEAPARLGMGSYSLHVVTELTLQRSTTVGSDSFACMCSSTCMGRVMLPTCCAC